MMDISGILVGETYRTAAGELRRVTARDGNDVTYTAAATAPHVPRAGRKTLKLEQFAQEAECEISSEPRLELPPDIRRPPSSR